MGKDSSNRKTEILKQKLKNFHELLEITIKQTKLVEDKDWARLHNAIDAKQARIDKIDSLNELFNKKKSVENQVENVDEIKKLNNEIEAIGKKIVEIEQSNISKINETKEILKTELKEIQVKKKVSTAYSDESSKEQGGQYLDKLK